MPSNTRNYWLNIATETAKLSHDWLLETSDPFVITCLIKRRKYTGRQEENELTRKYKNFQRHFRFEVGERSISNSKELHGVHGK